MQLIVFLANAKIMHWYIIIILDACDGICITTTVLIYI